MKAIIFGVTGQDGSHLADLLLGKDYSVVGVARRCSVDTTERIKHLENKVGFELIEGDITDAHSVMGILRQHSDVDEIYNLAAQSHVATSFTQPGLTWDITGKGCLNILQSMVDSDISARFYQASSSEMFGKNYDVVEEDFDADLQYRCGKYQNEDTKFLPQSPYAIAKCAAHYMTRLFREAYGVHASSGILFNHEGPRRGETFVTRKITKWIGEFVKWSNPTNELGQILLEELSDAKMEFLDRIDDVDDENMLYNSLMDKEGFPKLRLGNLDASRDWGYAGDYVEAMWSMLQQDNPDDYVICTGETHTIREFLDAAFSYIGITDWSDYVVVDPEFYRPAEVDYLKGDATKANTVLNWKPQTSFSELVKLMVDSDMNNETQLQ
jgi:GDPmannose 4,6-dehydratase